LAVSRQRCAALSRAILAAPQLREAIRSRGSIAEAQAMADRIMGAIAEYTVSATPRPYAARLDVWA